MNIFTTLKRASLLSVAVLCGFAVNAQTFDHEGITYKVSGTTVIIQKPSATIGTYSGDLVIPETVSYNGKDYTVASASATAFKGNEAITSVQLPNSINKLIKGQFSKCTNLRKVNIPTGVTAFPGNVFEYCSSIDSIVIPANITSINGSQFNGCTGLKYIEFAEAETEIEVDNASGLQAKYTAGSGDAAVDYISTLEEVVVNRPMTAMQPAKNPWRGNTSIKKVTFGGKCVSVYSNMFENCTSLTEINIPATVTSLAANAFANTGIASLDLHGGIATISSSAFQGCKNLTTVKLNEGTTFIDALAFNGSPVSSLSLPVSLTTIGKQAFNNCALTGDIVLPASVARINDLAFSGNTTMKTMALPASLTNLGEGVFQGCTGLTAITVDAANTTYKVKETGIVTTIDGATALAYPVASANASIVDAEITKVGAYTFQNATNLTTITLENCVNYGDYSLANTGAETLAVKGTVGRYVAANNAKLTSLSIDCNEVPVGIAQNCAALATFTSAQDVLVVKQDAFAGTAALKEINLGGLLCILEAGAFADCGVETLIVGAATPAAMAQGVFTEANSGITCKVPTSAVEAYKAAAGWQYLNVVGDANIALKGENITMPYGLYYAGKDGMIHGIGNMGEKATYDVGGVPHTFQLVEFKNRIYGASAGVSFTYTATAGNEGDGKLFYISQIDGNTFQAVVLDNAGNNAYKDPMGLYIYGDTLYVNDRNVCVRKISADAIALPQDYASWMENNWMGYYNQNWVYGCIKAGFAITQDEGAPLYWVGMRYNGNGIYRFKQENIGTSAAPGAVPDATKYGPILATVMSQPSAFYIDEANNHFYVYICAGNGISAGLYRVNLDALLANPDPSDFSALNPILVDGSPIKLEGAAGSQETAITQLSPSEDGYLYWCYIAPSDATKVVGTPAEAFDETNPLHKTGIKRIKLGEETPKVELHIADVEGYGVVPVKYTPGKDGVESVVVAVDRLQVIGDAVTVMEDAVVYVYNTAGVLVAQETVNGVESVSLADQANGVYVVKAVFADGAEQVVKVVR